MYSLDIDPEAQEQIDALPREAGLALAEVFAVLELTPWRGTPQNGNNPTGAMRRWYFGPNAAGQVVYLLIERDREVHVIMVQWWG